MADNALKPTSSLYRIVNPVDRARATDYRGPQRSLVGADYDAIQALQVNDLTLEGIDVENELELCSVAPCYRGEAVWRISTPPAEFRRKCSRDVDTPVAAAESAQRKRSEASVGTRRAQSC